MNELTDQLILLIHVSQCVFVFTHTYSSMKTCYYYPHLINEAIEVP